MSYSRKTEKTLSLFCKEWHSEPNEIFVGFQNVFIYHVFLDAIDVGVEEAKSLIDNGATGYTFPEALLKRPDVHIGIIIPHLKELRLFSMFYKKAVFCIKNS